MAVQQPQQIRVPNLPLGPMVDKDGNPTSSEITFRQTLVSSLQSNFGNEGLVAPSQQNTTAPNNAVTVIQNNQVINPATGELQYTCQGGTLIYDSTNNNLLVCILASDGTPTFHIVNVT